MQRIGEADVVEDFQDCRVEGITPELAVEVMVCLEMVLRSRRVEPEALLARADAVRERLRMPTWTAEALKDVKSAGRP